MQPDRETNPLDSDDPDLIRSVREVLEQAGFREKQVLDRLRLKSLPAASERLSVMPLWACRTSAGDPLDVLIRIFLLRESLALDVFRVAVEPTEPEAWATLGLIELGDDRVTSTVQLFPFGDLVLAADWPGQPADESRHVMAVSGSSRTLVDFTIRRPTKRTLDLGTGCGVQALLAAGHSDQVWAVDRNPRAVNLAAFNARLNGLWNVRCREGDLFAPIEGQTFDLIVANLPYVISPESRYLYCQGGLPGDDLCRSVVRASPRFLREGGCCQIISDLARVRGEDLSKRLAGWFEGTGCDAQVYYSLTLDVATYAAHWLRETPGQDLRPLASRFEAWMKSYAQQGIEAVSFGLIAMRRATGRKNWFHCNEVTDAKTPDGEDVVLGFAMRDFLEGVTDDEVLLNARLRAAPGLRWKQELALAPEGWSITDSWLQVEGRWGPGLGGDAIALFLVARCRGQAPLRDLLAELASESGETMERILPGCLALVRRLLETGLLWPGGG